MQVIKYEAVEDKIIEIRGEKIILDSDIAELYQVETKRINEAVKNNPEKFPEGYVIELTEAEWIPLRSKISTSIKGGRTYIPKAFTEKGMYMLATILKSKKATETTLAIIDAFAKIREVSRIVNQLPAVKRDSPEQQKLMQRAGDIISDLVVPDNMETDETEASIELNFAVVKFKYSVKKKAKVKV